MSAPYESEVATLSAVDENGLVAATSYATWRDFQPYPSEPARYAETADAFKWGSGTPGTGATINYWFDPASNWSDDEQNAFEGAMALWSAVANVTLVAADSQAAAAFRIIREPGAKAADWNNTGFVHPEVGSDTLASLTASPDNRIRIDTNDSNLGGFGPIGPDLEAGGASHYPRWCTNSVTCSGWDMADRTITCAIRPRDSSSIPPSSSSRPTT